MSDRLIKRTSPYEHLDILINLTSNKEVDKKLETEKLIPAPAIPKCGINKSPSEILVSREMMEIIET